MRTIFSLVTSLALVGCVTINIYFPAAAAEKVADKIIDEVWQAETAIKNKSEATVPSAREKELP